MENINSSLSLNPVARYRTELYVLYMQNTPNWVPNPARAPLSPLYVQCESISRQKAIIDDAFIDL